MGYDTGEDPRRRHVPMGVIVAAGVCLAVAVLGIGLRATPAKQTSPTAAVPATPDTPAPVSAPPPAEPVQDGTDAVEVGAPAAAWATVGAFLDGWQATDPEVRRTAFEASATVDLAAGLQDTAPGKVWTGERTGVQVVAASVTSAEFVVRISGRSPVRLVLIVDPGAPNGWRVSALAQDR